MLLPQPLALGLAVVGGIGLAVWSSPKVAGFLRLVARERETQAAFLSVKARARQLGDDIFPWSVADLEAKLKEQGYFLDLANLKKLRAYLRQGKPVGLRGEPGIGKSELPEALARAMGARFLDVACHSQLEASEVGVSWNAFRQIVDAQVPRATSDPRPDLYSMEYLNHTPLLESLLSEEPTVIRIDEVDKLNEQTTNFFLRYLDKKELVIHDLSGGPKTVKARAPLFIFLTSNEYHELDPAFHRRIAWIDLTFPTVEHLTEILANSAGVPVDFAARAAKLVVHLRTLHLKKKPSIGEAIEWVKALVDESDGYLSPSVVDLTLGFLVKHADDEQLAREALKRWYEGYSKLGA